MFATYVGSISSIKPQWHREDYYAVCVRRNVFTVFFNATFIGLAGAYLLVNQWAGVEVAYSDNSIRVVKATWEALLAGTGISIILCAVSAFILGRLIYGAGERAGFH